MLIRPLVTCYRQYRLFNCLIITNMYIIAWIWTRNNNQHVSCRLLFKVSMWISVCDCLYVITYRHHMWLSVCDCSYVIYRMWLFVCDFPVCGFPYVITYRHHMWLSVCDCPYVIYRMWLFVCDFPVCDFPYVITYRHHMWLSVCDCPYVILPYVISRMWSHTGFRMWRSHTSVCDHIRSSHVVPYVMFTCEHVWRSHTAFLWDEKI